MLYQLSYFRKTGGRRWIRTTEDIRQQIYSLPHLATLVFSQYLVRTSPLFYLFLFFHRGSTITLSCNNLQHNYFPEPMEGFEPPTS